MAITGVNGYNNLYGNYATQKRANAKETKETNKTDKTEQETQLKLSDNAKKLLEELKKAYGNMDFIIADYETEEEAAAYLSRGTKEYSVLIEPDVLEQMAADEAVKEKYLGLLNDATNQLTDMKEQLGDKKDEVTHLGVSIGEDGTVSYFAQLEKMSEKQRDRIDKAKEDKKEDKAVQEKSKRTKVQANSIEELLEKIKNMNWDNVKEEKTEEIGSRVDYSI